MLWIWVPQSNNSGVRQQTRASNLEFSRHFKLYFFDMFYVSMVPGGDESILYDPISDLRGISCILVWICR